MATHTSPAVWWDQDEATVMTVVAILDEVARAQNRAAGKSSKTDRKGGDNDGGS